MLFCPTSERHHSKKKTRISSHPRERITPVHKCEEGGQKITSTTRGRLNTAMQWKRGEISCFLKKV